jgi:predicted N-acyltransferase
MDTGGRKWGTPYLTRAFFDILGGTMADKVVLVMAEADGRPVGGALNLKGDDTLYGRYWGCLESHAFLHFEACYYQRSTMRSSIAWRGVEAGGAGRSQDPARLPAGEDLLGALDRRSGLPPRRRHFLKQERPAVEHELQALMEYSPFRQENG